MNVDYLRQLSYQCLLDLTTPLGIHASSLTEAYGCIFGRDSALTVLKILNVYRKTKDKQLLDISNRSLLTLAKLQGTRENSESGEEAGKIIHEYRPDNYERLIKRDKPWFVYEDGILRNYDSIDSTALTLIAWYRYWQITADEVFIRELIPHIERALQWITILGDKDDDYFLEYSLSPQRRHGGLQVQSWTDSYDSLKLPDGSFPLYPIAPIEVQAYVWLACRLWADFYKSQNSSISTHLMRYAIQLKMKFNEQFIIRDEQNFLFGAQALDGYKNPIITPTGNPLLCLWASYGTNGSYESIISDEYVAHFIRRAYEPDLFDEHAGIRTMSSLSPTYNPTRTSYHNGSFWPILNGLIHEGLSAWKYEKEAILLKKASLMPIEYFKTPIELYIKSSHGYEEFVSSYGKPGCRFQAWTAAAILDMVTD